MRPFVESFETRDKHKYIYDVETGTVVPDNDVLSLVIKKIGEDKKDPEISNELNRDFPKTIVEATLKFVRRWQAAYGGFLRNTSVLGHSHAVSEAAVYQEYDMGATYLMVLNLTENCNFRCKYCYLSEEYRFTRNRTESKMNFETAKEAIDRYFSYLERIKKKIPNKKAGITFYGGEPLLEFPLIKMIVNYCREKEPVPIVFNMTSNGYLLNDEISKFIVQNNIHLAISLDGSKANHDRNRVMPHGIGSFETVLKNIRKFMQAYPDYHDIGIISVFDVRTDLRENVRFFEENKLPRIFFINEVASSNTDYYDRFSREDFDKYNQTYEELLEEYIRAKQSGERISNYLEMFFEAPLSMTIIRLRAKDAKSKLVPYTNTCVPGMKISVRADGTYDICERINATFPVGDVEHGINTKAVCEVIDEYNKAVTKDCKNCTAVKNCPLCFAYTNGDRCFSIPDNFCKRWRKQQLMKLSAIYTILEKNSHAFDLLQNSLENSFAFNA